jgi:ribonuclease HI
MPGVDDNVCKACHSEIGSLHHRCCGCVVSAGLMQTAKHQGILRVAQSALHGHESLFQHGVPHIQTPSIPPPFVARWCGGVVVADFSFSGDVYTDGALRGGSRKGTERSGWAAVMIDAQGLVVGGIYGTCPDHLPSSLRAELWAVLQVLRHACPPVTMWVDNAAVVSGFAKGQVWCCSSSRPAADLWCKIWSKVDDLGGVEIQIRKVKGHTTAADVQRGIITGQQRDGNEHADHFARRGSALAEALSSTERERNAFKQAKEWYAWLTLLVANWPSDTQRRIAKRKRSPEGGSQRRRKGPSQCKARQASSSTTSVTGRFGAGHRIYRSGSVHWCWLCGAYVETRFKALGAPCQGDVGTGPRATQRARLRKGMHPLRPRERLPPPVRVEGCNASLDRGRR